MTQQSLVQRQVFAHCWTTLGKQAMSLGACACGELRLQLLFDLYVKMLLCYYLFLSAYCIVVQKNEMLCYVHRLYQKISQSLQWYLLVV